MKMLKLLLVLTVLPYFGTAHAAWTGPDGAACSGTLNGVAYSGVQRWTGNIAGVGNGSHYWTCCTKGTSCGPIKKIESVYPKALKDRKKSALDSDRSMIDQDGQPIVVKIDSRAK